MEYRGRIAVSCSGRQEWREWLTENHKDQASVWLIIFRKGSDIDSVGYDEAVDETLCFGWIDSLPNKRNSKSYYQYFSKRNPKSNWSRVNKNKVDRLIAEGRMATPGHEMMEIAKRTGTWYALNDVENLIVPKDMQEEFNKRKIAFDNWTRFPDSVKRGILEWIFNAKRELTRKKRIRETVDLAALDKRANQFRK